MQITAQSNQINDIGYVGEHYANDFLVDVSNVAEGTMIAEYQNVKGDKFLSGVLTKIENNAIVPLPESIMRYPGTVYIQVVSSVYDGEDIIKIDKSDRFECVVKESVQGDETEWHDNVDGLIKDLNDLIDRINNLDDLVPDNGITENKIADQAIVERHISDELFEQIQNGNGAIKAYTEFPTSPTEGDVFCLTTPATTSFKNYGFAKEIWGFSDEATRPYIRAVDVPLTLSFDIDTSKTPILDDNVTDFYGLIIANKITEDLAAIVYGTIDGTSDKCFLMYEKSRGADEDTHIKLGYFHAGTTIEGVTLVEQTGWYYITADSETDLAVLTPISEIDPEELLKAKIDNAIAYDIFYTVSDGVYHAMTDDVFDKLSICADVTLNPGIYQYRNGRWVDLLHHGTTQRFVEDEQWMMYKG